MSSMTNGQIRYPHRCSWGDFSPVPCIRSHIQGFKDAGMEALREDLTLGCKELLTSLLKANSLRHSQSSLTFCDERGATVFDKASDLPKMVLHDLKAPHSFENVLISINTGYSVIGCISKHERTNIVLAGERTVA
ncbi:hypothetical protein BS47DRAFT_1063021 [Hydnum rufescens UP504]|uniref:Uncharacterized protein n=1 Tax=Hydnum rufescens UP504 TaxID=1448309 RepID=A0A9P6DDX1_9AGAM|nr:hypothetical protein BS47DRAFT_1063021 [Hydnum rufescens UP504]